MTDRNNLARKISLSYQLTFTVSPTCFKKVVRADAIAELGLKKLQFSKTYE